MRAARFLVFLAATCAFAQNLTGRWTLATGGNSVFVLEQKGAQLTGRIEGPPGTRTYKIVDGYVRGNEVFFFVLHEAPDDPEVVENHGLPFHNTAKGTLMGNELHLSGSRENTKIREYQMVLRRAQ